MKRRGWLAGAALFAAGILPVLGGAARATTLLRMSVEEMTQKAQVIARVRCLGNSTGWDAGEIWTFTSFEVEETWRGEAPGERITVRLLGGRAGNVTSNVSGVPRFQPGEEVILFLEPTRGGNFSVVSWQQGTFRIWRGAAHGSELVTQDTAAFSIFDPAARQFRAEGIRNMAMASFRARVQSASRTRPVRAP